MSDVVLRCPSCGTTQSHTGECDACSESAVRYFCTNHAPGLWLDEPQCQACGAKFGQPSDRLHAPAARPVSPPPPRNTPRSEAPVHRPRDAESARTAPRRDPTTPAPPSIADLLARLLAERRRRAGYDSGEAWGKLPPEAPRLRLGGCLLRFMLLMLILLVLAFAGSFLFVGSMLQFFSGDLVQSTAQLSGTLEQRARGIAS